MADDRKVLKIREDENGEVRMADEVVAIIAGLAATEAEGVTSLAGNITNETVAKIGEKKLSKGIRINADENKVEVEAAINIAYGYQIPKVYADVQERIKSAIETMTGLEVTGVNVRIASVDVE
ncbi:MAG: Asp23/Gls24 family envelope stress response protein [Lachnospiraceae bacterium]|nr:Asp23/Gls24 family envelope stress response protein [Lachnospiraceae bacterium]